MPQNDLVIVGGAELTRRREMMRIFVELAGGPEGRFAILPTSTADPLGGFEKMKLWLGESGVDPGRVELLKVSAKMPGWERGAFEPAQTEKARAADGIWILGGDQNLTMDLLVDDSGEESPLLRAMRGEEPDTRGSADSRPSRRVKRPPAIGGTSAGAAVMSDLMIGNGTSFGALALPRIERREELDEPGCDQRRLFVAKGLGFFPYGIVDQHFDARSRLGRLLEAALVEDGARRLAFGISEATALVYKAELGELSAHGAGGVYVVDPRPAVRDFRGGQLRIRGARLHYLVDGDAIFPESGRIEFRGKRRIGPEEAEFTVERPEASGVLSAYSSLADFCARMLLDNSPGGLFPDDGPDEGEQSTEGGQSTNLRSSKPRGGYVRSWLAEEAEGRVLAWELRFGRREGESALWFGERYSFEGVSVDLLPARMERGLL